MKRAWCPGPEPGPAFRPLFKSFFPDVVGVRSARRCVSPAVPAPRPVPGPGAGTFPFYVGSYAQFTTPMNVHASPISGSHQDGAMNSTHVSVTPTAVNSGQ